MLEQKSKMLDYMISEYQRTNWNVFSIGKMKFNKVFDLDLATSLRNEKILQVGRGMHSNLCVVDEGYLLQMIENINNEDLKQE